LAVKSSNNSISVASNTTGIINSVNNSNSVIYWGYWKKDGEEDFQTGPTAAAPVVQTVGPTAFTSGQDLIGQVNAPIPSIRSITPATSGPSGAIGTVSTASNTNQILTGNTLIAALSVEIRAYKNLLWADRTISNYFLKPGRPGRIKYPKLTRDEFVKAATGILSPSFLRNLKVR
jgi:hypothetical protein